MTAVNLSRNFHIRNNTTLSDGTVISAKNYTPSLQGLLILMVSYLITSELPVDSRDYEPFAKAYLPLNVKNHFHRLLDDLGDDERKFLRSATTMVFRSSIFSSLLKKTQTGFQLIFNTHARKFLNRVPSFLFTSILHFLIKVV
jgi:hypothetical protein